MVAVRDSPRDAFALSMYMGRNRAWNLSPTLQVIWDRNETPWLFGMQPEWVTEHTTPFELDLLGSVESMTRITYEDDDNRTGYLFRASFLDDELGWYFVESSMHWRLRYMSSESAGRVPVPNPQPPGAPPQPRVAAIRSAGQAIQTAGDAISPAGQAIQAAGHAIGPAGQTAGHAISPAGQAIHGCRSRNQPRRSGNPNRR